MKVHLKNVRLAYAHNLFKPGAFRDDEDDGKAPKFSVNTLIDIEKQPKIIKMVEAAMRKAADEKWGKKGKETLRKLIKADRVCLRDGDLKDDEAFEGQMFINAKNTARPTVIDRDKTPLTMADGRPYSGCYANVILDIWAMDKPTWGKRICASLLGVQFVKDGEPFSASAPASADDFDDLGLDDDEFDEDEFDEDDGDDDGLI